MELTVSLMSSPDCKRQKMAEEVSPKKDCGTQTGDVTITASASNKGTAIVKSAQFFNHVARLDGFVDRTMLIKALLGQEPTYVMMFAPSKFGKTVNLNMIRTFCDIEDKDTKTKEDVAKDPTMQELRSNPSENMKVFLREFKDKQYEECMILKHEDFVIQHFGRHPVISFNFKDYSPTDESKAIYACAEQVWRGYKENFYLQDSKEFNNSKYDHLKKTCLKWCKYTGDHLKELDMMDVIRGLKILIMSLRVHWGRDPVFLVDEIDKPCIAAMQKKCSETQVKEIGTVISDVVCSILKPDNVALKLQAALITGICKLKNSGIAPVDNTMMVYFLGDARFSRYYGLTAQEVDTLVRKFYDSEGEAEIQTIIDNINKHYNGYYQRSFTVEEKPIEFARYCIFSVLSYIQQRNENKKNKTSSFWGDAGSVTELASLLKKSDVIMNAVNTLLFDNSGTIPIFYQRELYVEDILGIFRDEIDPSPDAVFNFFLQRGFLAHNLEKPEENIGAKLRIHVRIPNLEVKRLFNEMFKTYSISLPQSVTSAFISCGEFFQYLPSVLKSSIQNSTKIREHLDILCANLTRIFSFGKCQSEYSVNSYMLTILKFYAKYEIVELNYRVQYPDNGKHKNVYIDVWGQHGNFALILEVKHNRDANGEPGNIGLRIKSSLAAAEDVVSLLPNKQYPEDTSDSNKKAGTGKNLEVLNSSKIENYVLIGLAVDGDGTTHMLVFPNSTDWKDVIAVNPENHVAELISTHQNSK